jgi:hypothetical protein
MNRHDDIPIEIVDGNLLLPTAPPICHGYACGCPCTECLARENDQPAAQPWEPRPSRYRRSGDSMSTSTPTLAEAVAQARADVLEMEQVLNDLALVSHGRTVPVDGRVTGSKDHSPILRADEEPYPHEHYRDRWNQAGTAAARADVLADANAHLEALRKTPNPPEALIEPWSFAWKRMIANDPRTPTELARVYGVSRQSIHNWRRQLRSGSDHDTSRSASPNSSARETSKLCAR